VIEQIGDAFLAILEATNARSIRIQGPGRRITVYNVDRSCLAGACEQPHQQRTIVIPDILAFHRISVEEKGIAATVAMRIYGILIREPIMADIDGSIRHDMINEIKLRALLTRDSG
jgi:hypothetical protein